MTTIWDERYCTTAAPTISTTKQAEVVRAAAAEGFLALYPWAFNEARAWATIEPVHDTAYVRAVRDGEPRHVVEGQRKLVKRLAKICAAVEGLPPAPPDEE